MEPKIFYSEEIVIKVDYELVPQGNNRALIRRKRQISIYSEKIAEDIMMSSNRRKFNPLSSLRNFIGNYISEKVGELDSMPHKSTFKHTNSSENNFTNV